MTDHIEPWQIAERWERGDFPDRRDGEDRRKNPVEKAFDRLERDIGFYQRRCEQLADEKAQGWAMAEHWRKQAQTDARRFSRFCFVFTLVIGAALGMVGLTIARMLW